MIETSAKVLGFWENQAKEFGPSFLATIPDRHYRMLEIRRIGEQFRGADGSVLDVGCGNGFSTFHYAKAFPDTQFLGIDYSAEMIDHAQKQLVATPLPNLKFQVGNALGLLALNQQFDVITTTRCLINLDNWTQQTESLLQMKRIAKPNGRLILAENTIEGLFRLNELRVSCGLPEIKMRWHNHYLPEKLLFQFLYKNFRVVSQENIGNLYYIASRVIYAKLQAMEGKEPDYENPINEIAAQLPSLGNRECWSPNFLFVLINNQGGTNEGEDAQAEREMSSSFLDKRDREMADIRKQKR